ncbi:carboxymuconolactone decarboxylase family protein [Rhodococcus sp. D2-41]|uniref:Carboxymuconolactone decarboxylase family protein n=1 Tax=Speluncibacter jeojiensis TaxID=2710754 RepID=A0A9X4LWR2_9ACTN|nr:carboxymuconolactone decarboxylase family protein [Rhodococcus sp. D2-41]MDG3012074.1 carboxymuconolactone decarboxylase family protein [Rhodococcus sp. D2-41]MDG3013599.1 carboxymuconolactone decarboxylase family protein [Corynebacteriales bacterium D3-21]
MSTSPRAGADDLGGRLRLLPVDEFDAAQSALHGRLLATRGARADDAGYRAVLRDGRLIGPFNGFIRAPVISAAQLDWAQAISAGGLPDDVREVAILTVGAEWATAYVLYAHSRAARKAGISDPDIAALRVRQQPAGLSPEADLAHRLTVALVRDHDVPDDLYTASIAAFGESATVTLIALIGQYLTTSALLTCFRVPTPPESDPTTQKEYPCHSSRSSS